MRPPISNRQTQLAWRAPYNIHRGEISTKEKCDSVRGAVTTLFYLDAWGDQAEIF